MLLRRLGGQLGHRPPRDVTPQTLRRVHNGAGAAVHRQDGHPGPTAGLPADCLLRAAVYWRGN